MKYNFDLDLHTNNSLSIITKRIKPNSVVLEFGPANGRLTRFLKEYLNCSVYIVEIEEEAAKEAMLHAKECIIGDIESFIWFESYKHMQFDHIIFADVLEHLVSPLDALKKASELLSAQGTVLISVPNIAHNSVLIDLINNKFEYRKIGLLDDTHLKFFTEANLRKLADDCDLVSTYEDAVYKKVVETEFGNFYDQIPKDMQYSLKTRPYGNIYQFIFELMRKDDYQNSNKPVVKKLVQAHDNYQTQIYVDSGNGYSENLSITQSVKIGLQHLEFLLSDFEDIQSVRFDPVNTNCIVHIQHIKCIMKDGSEHAVEITSANEDWSIYSYYLFRTDDPIIIMSVPTGEIDRLVIDFELLQIDFDPDMGMMTVIKLFNEYANQTAIQSAIQLTENAAKASQELEKSEIQNDELRKHLQQAEEQIRHLLEREESDKEHIQAEHLKLLQSEERIRDLEALRELDMQKIEVNNNEISQLTNRLNQLSQQIEDLKHTKLWALRKKINEIHIIDIQHEEGR